MYIYYILYACVCIYYFYIHMHVCVARLIVSSKFINFWMNFFRVAFWASFICRDKVPSLTTFTLVGLIKPQVLTD